MIGKTNDHTLPSHASKKDIADKFINFFDNKISKIRNNFTTLPSTADEPETQQLHIFNRFQSISQSDLEKNDNLR